MEEKQTESENPPMFYAKTNETASKHSVNRDPSGSRPY